MSEWSSRLQEFVNGIAASVAVVSHHDSGALDISACNEIFFEMTGGRPLGVHNFPLPFDSMVPSYARRELRERLQECFSSGTAQELEEAFDLRDGTHWWRLSLKPLRHREADQAVLEILLTGLDITPKMLLTRQLEISTSRFRSVVDAAYDAIITIDQQHNITLFNRAAEYLFGYSQAEMIGQPLTHLIPEKFRENHSAYINQFARSPVNSRQMDERNRIYGLHRDGSLVPVEIAISKINVNGLLEFTAIIRDIADRVHLMDLLQKEAETDPLTGLPNRRTFLESAENLFRSSETVSLYMIDIDHFKTFNDTYGHDIGDEILRALAEVGKVHTRKTDVFARLGGDEFAALLPGKDLEHACSMAENLRTAIEQQNFVYKWPKDQAIPFTVTIGVAERAPGEADVTDVLKRADQALYKAKEGGKNRVVCG
ncbi:MAG: diguanylate cyclase [Verrucomicrobia bacterium]|nr:diguanylate cyclase [Verrucomicrobiota bacterium]